MPGVGTIKQKQKVNDMSQKMIAIVSWKFFEILSCPGESHYLDPQLRTEENPSHSFGSSTAVFSQSPQKIRHQQILYIVSLMGIPRLAYVTSHPGGLQLSFLCQRKRHIFFTTLNIHSVLTLALPFAVNKICIVIFHVVFLSFLFTPVTFPETVALFPFIPMILSIHS